MNKNPKKDRRQTSQTEQRAGQIQAEIARLQGEPTQMLNAKSSAFAQASALVQLNRQRRGIDRFKEMKWKPNEIRLLGTMSDADLAAKLGRSQASVEYMRLKLGKDYSASKSRPWTKSELLLLGKFPDARVAEMTHRTQKAVQVRRLKMRHLLRAFRPWTADEIKLLGNLPDRVVAQRTGRTLVAVQLKRRFLKLSRSKLRSR
jgi:hypothetical protein